MYKIHVVVTGLSGAVVIEGDAGNGTGPVDFRSRIDLLGEGVIGT